MLESTRLRGSAEREEAPVGPRYSYRCEHYQILQRQNKTTLPHTFLFASESMKNPAAGGRSLEFPSRTSCPRFALIVGIGNLPVTNQCCTFQPWKLPSTVFLWEAEMYETGFLKIFQQRIFRGNNSKNFSHCRRVIRWVWRWSIMSHVRMYTIVIGLKRMYAIIIGFKWEKHNKKATVPFQLFSFTNLCYCWSSFLSCSHHFLTYV